MPVDIDLSILIVNWNTRDRTLACIRSIRQFAPGQAGVQIIVIDNDSEDGSVEAIRQTGLDVEIIENKENAGFGRANNAGLERARGRIVLFLNSDTEITENTLPDLLAEFEKHPEVAAFGCKILGYDEIPQHSVRGFPSLGAYLYSDTLLGMLGMFKGSHERYRRKQFDFEQWQPIEVAMGAALAGSLSKCRVSIRVFSCISKRPICASVFMMPVMGWPIHRSLWFTMLVAQAPKRARRG
jgi:GT2 family glycosyltransferase